MIVDENGAVTMKEDGHDDTRDTAQSHSSTPPNPQAFLASTNQVQGFDATADEPSKEGDDVAELLKGMKKKKSKKPKADDGEAEGGDGEGDEAAADGGLDLSTMKKKKKKVLKDAPKDDFAARIAALDIEGKEDEEAVAPAAEKKPVDEGDMEKGTGIWQHDETKAVSYELLLSRFFNLLAQKNPDHASSGSRSYKIPPPQCLREGNKKTIFANIAEICKRMKRTDEHVTSYLFAELGTSGSVDGSRRLVIKGRFQQKQIENVLRRYISKSLENQISKMLHLLTVAQWNTSLARPAGPQTPSSTRGRTDCTSSLATPVAPVAVLLPSRPVSLPRSARDGDSRVRGRGRMGSGLGITKCSHHVMLQGSGSILGMRFSAFVPRLMT